MDITSISALVASGSVLAGVVFAMLEVRTLVRTRQTDLILRVLLHANTKEQNDAKLKFYLQNTRTIRTSLRNMGLCLLKHPFMKPLGW